MKRIFKNMDPDDVFVILGFCCMGVGVGLALGGILFNLLSAIFSTSNRDTIWLIFCIAGVLWLICWIIAVIIKITRGKKK